MERHGHQVKKINRLIDSLKQEKVTRITLGGCVIEKTILGKIWIYREIKRRCLSVVIMPGEKRRWDNRFEVFQNFDKKLDSRTSRGARVENDQKKRNIRFFRYFRFFDAFSCKNNDSSS